MNIALLEDGHAVLGIVHAPALGRRYWAARILLTRAMRERRLAEMLIWLLRHGLSRFEIGRATVSAWRGLINGENPLGL